MEPLVSDGGMRLWVGGDGCNMVLLKTLLLPLHLVLFMNRVNYMSSVVMEICTVVHTSTMVGSG